MTAESALHRLDLRFRHLASAAGLVDVTSDLAESPLGVLLVAATEGGLCRVSFQGEEALDELASTLGRRVLRLPGGVDQARRQLDEYFAGRRHAFDLSLDLAVRSFFQAGVLAALADLPYGELTTCGRLASSLGRPGAAPAVGAALHRNSLPVVLPCHRVVGADGRLVGYASGLERKRRLLELEGALGLQEGARPRVAGKGRGPDPRHPEANAVDLDRGPETG